MHRRPAAMQLFGGPHPEAARRPTEIRATDVTRPKIDFAAANCDLVITSDAGKNGSVSSPGYPQPYPPRSLCRYEFQGKGKERVQLVFTDFNLYTAGDDDHE